MTQPSSPFFKTPARQATRSGSLKPSLRRNTSILQFFSKTDTPPKPTSSQHRITQYISKRGNSSHEGPSCNGPGNNEEEHYESLFVEDIKLRNDHGVVPEGQVSSRRERSKSPDDFWASIGRPDITTCDGGDGWCHSEATAAKRRRIGNSSIEVNSSLVNEQPLGGVAKEEKEIEEKRILTSTSVTAATPPGRRKYTGPFLIDSDDSDEMGSPSRPSTPLSATVAKNAQVHSSRMKLDRPEGIVTEQDDIFQIPGGSDCDEPQDFIDLTETHVSHGVTECSGDEEVAVCPICQTALPGLTDDATSLHVNRCLDGNATPVPSETKIGIAKQESKTFFSRSALRVMARPGQKAPFTIGSTITESSSAFSKIMSGNAEDAAWSAAAANEIASRGKQAYERTCPFYKILPGFSICVDAFRYGAVEGCNAYFLSHFHSDHYVGLNSNWSHGPIYCSRITGNLVRQQLKVDPKWVVDLEFEKVVEVPETGGARVTMIPANHCPGSSLFLFEKNYGWRNNPRVQRILHCGDFRASPAHIQHPLLTPNVFDQVSGEPRQRKIDVCYLDTTYLNPKYAFPTQEDVISACAQMCVNLNENKFEREIWKREKVVTETDKANSLDGNSSTSNGTSKSKLLVVIGTYSIGKERICLGIAKALGCKIFATAAKQRICACLEDSELSSLLTNDPLEAQVHMQSLMEIRADTLSDYLASFRPHFTHVVGFRPTGWNYRPPAGLVTDNPPVSRVLHSETWKARFTIEDLVPQRGSNKHSSCFGVPYSEHSSFRELTMFCCALRIGKIIPTVNVGSRKSREKMKAWVEKWEAEKRKSGLFKVEEGATRW
ncbi:DNA cross-link repair protein PSO2/SNM1 [Emydomyces testavorans]|uniref:DNA cross-link repair protein PSO2/SNM1 n=1 Tax=Emydomyces testavorans TaxID=2070801 RepID=A0AAF0IJG2_9EURO|nr:DNA cross-link repair protein PSO2/SNM1 [Emydomyces testavorans]